MTDPIEYLDVDDLVALAVALLGDPPPIRDLGLLAAAAARPQASAFGDDAYPDLWTKAAALLHSVVKNHALIDGNKRLGWLASAVFLEINGPNPTTASNDDVYDLVINVAAHPIEIDQLAHRLRTSSTRMDDRSGPPKQNSPVTKGLRIGTYPAARSSQDHRARWRRSSRLRVLRHRGPQRPETGSLRRTSRSV